MNGIGFASKVFWVLLFVTLQSTVYAQSERLRIHGFAAQGALLSEDNNFIVEDELNFHLTELGINASYQLNDVLRLAGQLAYIDRGGRVEQDGNVDYLFLDYAVTKTLDRQFNIYLGRYKNSDWLYSDVIDIPHARPSIFLPQSLYKDAFREVAIGALGISFRYNQAFAHGDGNLTLSYGEPDVTNEFSRSLLNRRATGTIDADHTFNGSLWWQSESGNWRAGLAYFSSENSYERAVDDLVPVGGELSIDRFILSGVLNGESWELASELSYQTLAFRVDNARLTDLKKNPRSVYLQGRWFKDDHWTLITRWDHYDGDEQDTIQTFLRDSVNLITSDATTTPGYFKYQSDIMAGFSYRFDPQWRLQAEYHYIKGTALISPLFFREVSENDKEHWEIWALQLSYKF